MEIEYTFDKAGNFILNLQFKVTDNLVIGALDRWKFSSSAPQTEAVSIGDFKVEILIS